MHLRGREARCVHRSLVPLQLPQQGLALWVKHLETLPAFENTSHPYTWLQHDPVSLESTHTAWIWKATNESPNKLRNSVPYFPHKQLGSGINMHSFGRPVMNRLLTWTKPFSPPATNSLPSILKVPEYALSLKRDRVVMGFRVCAS